MNAANWLLLLCTGTRGSMTRVDAEACDPNPLRCASVTQMRLSESHDDWGVAFPTVIHCHGFRRCRVELNWCWTVGLKFGPVPARPPSPHTDTHPTRLPPTLLSFALSRLQFVRRHLLAWPASCGAGAGTWKANYCSPRERRSTGPSKSRRRNWGAWTQPTLPLSTVVPLLHRAVWR